MPDVNVLVYAYDDRGREHQRYAQWLIELAAGPEPFALSEPVLQGFLRVVTNPRLFIRPAPQAAAFRFIDALTSRKCCSVLRPGNRHWQIFRGLCESASVQGKLVADAAHAALAIETGCEWVTADTDFARFSPPLRWTHL
jgi:toxin-antitoxin system PIN domain toxin